MQKDTDWLTGRIKIVPALTAKTFVSVAPSGTDFPFVVVHPQDGTDDTDRLTGPNINRHPRFTIHSVGKTAQQAQAVGEAVKAQLIVHGFGVVPDVPGEWCGRVWYSVPTAIQVDKDLTPWWFTHVAECGWPSQTL